MPVKTPGKVLLHNVPLKFVHDRVAGGGRRGVDAQIVLVPFIDFLITLVVFLLSMFNASGELMAQIPSITMPEAKNTTSLEIAPIVQVDAQLIMLDGNRMVDTKAATAEDAPPIIEPLVQALDKLRRDWDILHPAEPFAGTVIMQADQGIDFMAIKKVMASAAQAGYANVSFAVNKTGD